MRSKILEPQQEHTFSYFYSLNNLLEDIVAEFGYTTALESLVLPRGSFDEQRAEALRESYHTTLLYISLTTEVTWRELLHHAQVRINIEYPLNLENRLRRTLDYLLRGAQQLMIMEAKRGDIEAGFNQLAVQLIALNEAEATEASPRLLYGAVSSGSAWRFGVLDRATKHIVQNFKLYTLPDDTALLLSILIGILGADTPNADA
ncbi:MAG: hypothetical protein AAF614_21840 [Chloroflexota bacterium]